MIKDFLNNFKSLLSSQFPDYNVVVGVLDYPDHKLIELVLLNSYLSYQFIDKPSLEGEIGLAIYSRSRDTDYSTFLESLYNILKYISTLTYVNGATIISEGKYINTDNFTLTINQKGEKLVSYLIRVPFFIEELQ